MNLSFFLAEASRQFHHLTNPGAFHSLQSQIAVSELLSIEGTLQLSL